MKEKKEVKENKTDKLNVTKNKKMIVFYIAISLFAILALLIHFDVTDKLDNVMESFIIGIRSNSLTTIMTAITNLSRAYALIALSIIILFVVKNKKKALLIFLNLTCVFLNSQLLKIIFKRTRPDGEHLVSVSGYAFPSGHAMVSLAYFAFILYLINKKIKKKHLRIILTIITSIMIFLIGFSRIYLGVHYTSDVIGGFLASCAYLMIFLTIIDKKEVKE